MAQSLTDHVVTEIRAEMARQRVTQRQLASVVGVSQVQISKRLSGRIQFDVAELEKVASVLGVPVTNFLPAPGHLPRQRTRTASAA
jgi:transcriptional regulator with XRE-family HTH domain